MRKKQKAMILITGVALMVLVAAIIDPEVLEEMRELLDEMIKIRQELKGKELRGKCRMREVSEPAGGSEK